MATRKGGRPLSNSVEKRSKVLKLRVSMDEFSIIQSKAKGFISISDFIRNRIFYDSTLQQVQPEEFLRVMKGFLEKLAQNKMALDEVLGFLKGKTDKGDIIYLELLDTLKSLFLKQIKVEQESAKFMQKMLRAAKKTEL